MSPSLFLHSLYKPESSTAFSPSPYPSSSLLPFTQCLLQPFLYFLFLYLFICLYLYSSSASHFANVILQLPICCSSSPLTYSRHIPPFYFFLSSSPLRLLRPLPLQYLFIPLLSFLIYLPFPLPFPFLRSVSSFVLRNTHSSQAFHGPCRLRNGHSGILITHGSRWPVHEGVNSDMNYGHRDELRTSEKLAAAVFTSGATRGRLTHRRMTSRTFND